MKKFLIFIIVIVLAAPIFTACKKGEDDPFLTIKSRNARLIGEWEMVDYNQITITTTTIASTTSTSTETTTYSGTTYTNTVVDDVSDSNTGTVAYSVTFNNDGTFDRVINITVNHDGYTSVTITTEKGVWYWASGNNELDTKNKEVLVMQLTSHIETFTSGSYTDTDSYTWEGLNCPLEYLQIKGLSSKEITFNMEGKYSNNDPTIPSSTTTTAEGKMEK